MGKKDGSKVEGTADNVYDVDVYRRLFGELGGDKEMISNREQTRKDGSGFGRQTKAETYSFSLSSTEPMPPVVDEDARAQDLQLSVGEKAHAGQEGFGHRFVKESSRRRIRR